MNEYWVYTWLDSHRVRNIDDLKIALASKSTLRDLKQSAELVVDAWRSSKVEARPASLIGGAGIDLSGRLDCYASDCIRAQVDRLFRRAWHYFETVVARDAIAEDLIVHGSCPDEELCHRLLPHFQSALIVRELGAEALVEFLPRVPACFEHWRQHAKEAGIDDIAEREPDIVNRLLVESDVSVESEGDEAICTINHPDFSHTQWVRLSSATTKGQTEEQIKHAGIGRVARIFLVHLSADLSAAKMYGGSFGSTIPMFQKLLAHRDAGIGTVALEVQLPVLEGLSTVQLVEVRLEYKETFTRFRKRLVSFFEECTRRGAASPAEIQATLKADLVDRELDELRKDLERAQQSLKRKTAYALSLGSLVATIGAVTGIMAAPAAYALAATVSAASLSPGVSKYVDDVAKIKSDDMYFLLQAEAHHLH